MPSPWFHLMCWNNNTLFEDKHCPCTQDLRAFICGLTNTAWRELGHGHRDQSPLGQQGGGQQVPQPGGTWAAWMSTSHSSLQSHPDTELWEGKHFTWITWGSTLRGQQPAPMGCTIYWACVQRNPGFVCIPIPTTFHSDPFENISLIGTYIHTCKHMEGNRSLHGRAKHLYSFYLRI